jgi:site-specific recombinase XerD
LSLASGTPRDYAILQVFLQTGVRVSELATLRLWLVARPASEYRTLFLNRFQQPMGVRGIQKLVERYRQGAGIEKRITPHSLRHTFGTQKARMGATAFQLRDFMGHANLATTQLYVHLSQEDGKKVMEATSL